MSESRLLRLLATRDVHRALQILEDNAGTATARQMIDTGGTRTLQAIAALAVEGFAARDGTWDLPAAVDTVYRLTDRGWVLVERLREVEGAATKSDGSCRPSPGP
jgi:hypothetical protein